ncbi:MAG: CoA transferase [Acidimicrobiales bacterium]
MLSQCRVIDCTDERGQLAGFLLAQLGAEVILVEPPGGSGARYLPPFAGDQRGPETGLWHWAYNRGKQSVIVDCATSAGLDRLRSLLAGADVWLWTGSPAELPISPEEAAAINPALVTVALTPFGLDGPKADWAATDLTICASSCAAELTGDSDRAPLRWGSPQAFLHGAADMTVAALLGLHERSRSGRGQLADLSAQQSAMAASFCYTINDAWSFPAMGRSGDGINFGPYKMQWTFPAADGSVSITFSFGAAMARFTTNLFRWIWEEGECDEATRDLPWAELIEQLGAGTFPVSEVERLNRVIAAFTASRTKADLFAEATRRRVLLAPIAVLSEVMENEHLAARAYWDEVAFPSAGRTVRFPGRFVRSTVAPLRTLGPAPRLGEHDELVPPRAGAPGAGPAAAGAVAAPDATGVAVDARVADVSGAAGERVGPGVPSGPAIPDGSAALEGLKVLDLAWSVAGPMTGRTLADFGATVVRVETRERPCVARTTGPFHPDRARSPLESSGMWADINAGKLGLELDLSRPEGVEVALDLVRWADVVVESFSAGSLERMGLGYQRMADINPGVILLSSSLPGQTGVLQLPGLGNLATALFGFTSTTGWPDRTPSGPFGAYTDIVAPRFALAATLAALQHRQRTGQGQHLDLSQAESSLHLQTPALLDAEVNGVDLTPRGNRDLTMAPHGIYPARGQDRWIAIACQHEDAWRALAVGLGRPDLADCPLAQRLDRQDELDGLIAAWSADQDPEVLQAHLQALGIAAHQVQASRECLADPQLAHRGHYGTVTHPLWGPVLVERPRLHLSRTPGTLRGPGPMYGQHTHQVLGEFLGYPDHRLAELAAAGVLGPVVP